MARPPSTTTAPTKRDRAAARERIRKRRPLDGDAFLKGGELGFDFANRGREWVRASLELRDYARTIAEASIFNARPPTRLEPASMMSTEVAALMGDPWADHINAERDRLQALARELHAGATKLVDQTRDAFDQKLASAPVEVVAAAFALWFEDVSCGIVRRLHPELSLPLPPNDIDDAMDLAVALGCEGPRRSRTLRERWRKRMKQVQGLRRELTASLDPASLDDGGVASLIADGLDTVNKRAPQLLDWPEGRLDRDEIARRAREHLAKRKTRPES